MEIHPWNTDNLQGLNSLSFSNISCIIEQSGKYLISKYNLLNK